MARASSGSPGHPRGDADEQRRGEDAAGAADPDGQAGREDLPEGEHDQEPDRVAAVGGLEHDRVADAVHPRERERQQAEHDAEDGGPGRDRRVEGSGDAARRAAPQATIIRSRFSGSLTHWPTL
jgi:hypothetical protein